MRLPILLIVPLLAGCLNADGGDAASMGPAEFACEASEHVWYLSGPADLVTELPTAAALDGNAFTEAFLTNDMIEFRSPPLESGLRLSGNVTIEYWVEETGAPAPVVIGRDPGEGYHFFNQFGAGAHFMPSYAIENAAVLPTPESVVHYVETLAVPPSGYFMEPGDEVRLLLTSLVLAEGDLRQKILVGGETPSQVRFTAACWTPPEWTSLDVTFQGIDFPINRGLLTGAIPASALNEASFTVSWSDDAQWLQFFLTQVGDPNPLKDDVDFSILAPDGTEVWSGGSPYSDESALLWRENLEALLPDGEAIIHVASYSGIGYSGVFHAAAGGGPDIDIDLVPL